MKYIQNWSGNKCCVTDWVEHYLKSYLVNQLEAKGYALLVFILDIEGAFINTLREIITEAPLKHEIPHNTGGG